MKNAWWLVPVAFLAWIGFKKYDLSKKYVLNFKRINLSDLSFANPVVNIIYEIVNPTDTTANVQSVTGALFYNGIFIGNVVDFKQFTIKQGATEFVIKGKINYSGLSQLILNLSKKFQIYFEGTIKVDFVDFPIKFVYDFNR
jgi:LEA14-like dessication related protein